jgi:hypothetical protein
MCWISVTVSSDESRFSKFYSKIRINKLMKQTLGSARDFKFPWIGSGIGIQRNNIQ